MTDLPHNPVKILWTGGFDSTFRVLQLSHLPITIHPYYMSDNRKSEEQELSAIKNITEKIKNRKEKKAEILPLKIVKKEERKKDGQITEAFQRLVQADYMGSQYEWLGTFAKDHEGVELSIHEDDKAIKLIKKHGRFLPVEDEHIGEYFTLDTKNSSGDVCAVFQHFHFPLVKFTKLCMKEKYLRWNCEDIMNLTWFCFTPINGKPCGKCNSCRYTIEEGMASRFTKPALLRYRLIPVKKFIKKTLKRARGIHT